MHILILIVVLGLLIFALSRDYSDFLLVIDNGIIVKTKGKVSSKLRNDVEDAIKDVKNGKILGNNTSQGIKLTFKGEVSEFTQQRLRNIVGLYQR